MSAPLPHGSDRVAGERDTPRIAGDGRDGYRGFRPVSRRHRARADRAAISSARSPAAHPLRSDREAGRFRLAALVPVTLIVYCPACCGSNRCNGDRGPLAGGVAVEGLTEHTGKLSVNWVDVTTQLNETKLSNPLTGCRSMIEVALPPGSTPALGWSVEVVSVKLA